MYRVFARGVALAWPDRRLGTAVLRCVALGCTAPAARRRHGAVDDPERRRWGPPGEEGHVLSHRWGVGPLRGVGRLHVHVRALVGSDGGSAELWAFVCQECVKEGTAVEGGRLPAGRIRVWREQGKVGREEFPSVAQAAGGALACYLPVAWVQ